MSGIGLFGAIIIGLLAGAVAGRSATRHHGVLTSLPVGLVGAMIGGFLANVLELTASGPIPGLIASAAGAIVLLSLLRLIPPTLRLRRA